MEFETQTDLFDSAYNSLVKEVSTSPMRITSVDLDYASKKLRVVGYDMDDKRKAALRAYLEGKPLFLAGDIGTGKTLFFNALNRAGLARENIIIYSLKAHDGDSMEALMDFLRQTQNDEIVIDDIGTEHDKIDYGNHHDVFATIVAFREACKIRG